MPQSKLKWSEGAGPFHDELSIKKIEKSGIRNDPLEKTTWHLRKLKTDAILSSEYSKSKILIKCHSK